MAGHGQKITRKMHAAIAALLTEPTYSAAAARAGVHADTLGRWLKRPDFNAAYRQARRQVVDHAIARLSALTGKAIDALGRHVEGGTPALEVRAAVALLDSVRRLQDGEDLEERIAELEARLEALQPTGPRRAV
jgi:hypothetical protein